MTLRGSLVALALIGLALGCSGRVPATATASAQARAADADATRAIIRTASVVVEVADPAQALTRSGEVAKELGGFVQESRRQSASAASVVLRVPSSRLDEALDRLAALGRERERSSSATDVTEQVADLEASLTNDRALRDRLRALLARAKTVEEVLRVESELTRLQTQIDRAEGRLKRLRGEVELSALSASFQRRRILGPLGYALQGVVWVIEKLFVIRD